MADHFLFVHDAISAMLEKLLCRDGSVRCDYLSGCKALQFVADRRCNTLPLIRQMINAQNASRSFEREAFFDHMDYYRRARNRRKWGFKRGYESNGIRAEMIEKR